MTDHLYRISDRELLQHVVALESEFQAPRIVLEGLTEEQATAKPQHLPHSIADLVAHMCYWQEYFNSIATSGFTDFPEHAADGWPEVHKGEWETWRERYLTSLSVAQKLAADSPNLDRKLLPTDSSLPVLKRDTGGSGLLSAAVHCAHHLGQIVTIRQLIAAWPPPSGGLTW